MPLSFLASRPSSMTIFAFFSCGFCTKEKIFFDFFRKKTLRRQGALKSGSSFPKRLFVRFPQAFQKPAYLTPSFPLYKTRKEFPASKKSAKSRLFKARIRKRNPEKIAENGCRAGERNPSYFLSRKQSAFRGKIPSTLNFVRRASKPLLFRLPTQKRYLTVKRRPFGNARRLFPPFRR